MAQQTILANTTWAVAQPKLNNNFDDLYAGAVTNDAAGLAWNEDTGTFTRIGTLSGYSATYSNKPFSNVPDYLLPIQRGMKRCVVEDDGTVDYYLLETDSTKKADGSAAVLDGTDGQVMVEIPEHWWKYEKSGDTHYWWISPTEITEWNQFEKSYIGAYEAAIFDNDAEDYVGGSSKIVDTANDKLASVAAGVTAHTNETRDEYRSIADNRNPGAGWHQMDNRIYAAVTRLMIIEYANFNFQDKISTGLTDADSGDWSNYNSYSPLHNAGLTNSLGNVTGEVSLEIEEFVDEEDTLETQVCSYRGIENPYGHLWKFLDGVNVYNETTETVANISNAVHSGGIVTITTSSAHGLSTDKVVKISGVVGMTDINDTYIITDINSTTFTISETTAQTYTSGGIVRIGHSQLYVCSDPSNYDDDTDTDYDLEGSLAETDGYGLTLMPTEDGFFPASVGADSETGLCDCYYTYYDNGADSGWRVVLVGGFASCGGSAGVFCVTSSGGASYDEALIGARLCAKF